MIILLFLPIGFFLFLNSYLRNLFVAIFIFLGGSFYCLIYQKIFLDYNKITSKIFVVASGKVESIDNYQNNLNSTAGIKFILKDIALEKSPYKSKEKNSDNKKDLPKKSSNKKLNISQSKIIKDFINIDNYQEVDRPFQDLTKNYQVINWQKIGDKSFYPKPPPKLSFIARNNFIKNEIAVNDIIRFKVMIENDYQKEFPDDFDLNIYNETKKIGGFGIAIGDIEIVEKAKISNLDSWFLNLRAKISKKIINALPQNQSAIALALLVGDKSKISDENLEDIRNSGLAHLISISGFHMSLAGAIFFFLSRFLLSRNENLTLKYDIKKFAGIISLLACYFYFKISGSLIPTQRAFLAIIFVFLAFLFSEKVNLLRILAIIALIITLINPYNTSSIGFQLSFIAVLTIITVCTPSHSNYNPSFLGKSLVYGKNILISSAIIQIITLPFLLHSFGKFSLFSPLANLLAIPLTSFIIMPLGFLSFFLMPIGLEKFSLILMGQAIECIIYIAHFFANLKYSYFTAEKISGISLAICFFGVLLFVQKVRFLKVIGLIVFIIPLFFVGQKSKYNIAFDNEQKFFVIYDKEEGLRFSKKIRKSKQRDRWLEYFNEDDFKYLDNCKESCLINLKNKIFYIITNRNKISDICKTKNYDLIVNLNENYKLPDCIKTKKIDNIDFYHKGGHFIKIINDKLQIDYTK